MAVLIMRTPPRHVVPVILYAILAILVIPVFPHFVSPNELSRWDLAVAIVDFHTIEVDARVATTDTETEDLSKIDGRLYSNKAPGAALIGLPGYAIARAIVGPPSPHNIRVTLTAMRLLASTTLHSAASSRATFLALVVTPLSIILTFAGYPNWHGGWTVGARYLVPALPFFALLIAFAAPRFVDRLLLGVGAAIWFFAGFLFARSGSRNIRAVVEAVHFQDGSAIQRVAPHDARTDFWPF